MHTKLRMMALGVVLLGGAASVAQAEVGPECGMVEVTVEYCHVFLWAECANLRPSCAVEAVYCDPETDRLTCWYFSA